MYLFDECPRCGVAGLERLVTHTYCVQCNYCPDLERDNNDALLIPGWVGEFLDDPKSLEVPLDLMVPEEDDQHDDQAA